MITNVFLGITVVVILLLGWFFFKGLKQRKEIARQIGISEKETKRNHLIRAGSGILLIILLSLGFFAPLIQSYEEITFYTSDVLFLTDESRSMAAESQLGLPNRLERSELIMTEFSEVFRNLNVSIYGFTREVRSHLFWTDDYNDFRNAIKYAVQIEGVPTNGTDLGKAISRAINYFPEESESKVIILLSDGENTGKDSDLQDALVLARQKNVKIITIGVGERQGALIPIYNKAGQLTDFENRSGIRVVTYHNETALKRISESTYGVYTHEENLEPAFQFLSNNLIEKKREVLAQDTILRKVFLVLSLIPLFFLTIKNL